MIGTDQQAEDNKPNNGYFFDTAATKSFTNGKVNNPRPIFGKRIIVANGGTLPIEEKGILKIGKIPIEFYVSKGIQKNLVSGITLMKDGYNSLLEANGNLSITKGDEIMATGKYNPEIDLIEMDDIQETHECNEATINTEEDAWHEVQCCSRVSSANGAPKKDTFTPPPNKLNIYK